MASNFKTLAQTVQEQRNAQYAAAQQVANPNGTPEKKKPDEKVYLARVIATKAAQPNDDKNDYIFAVVFSTDDQLLAKELYVKLHPAKGYLAETGIASGSRLAVCGTALVQTAQTYEPTDIQGKRMAPEPIHTVRGLRMDSFMVIDHQVVTEEQLSGKKLREGGLLSMAVSVFQKAIGAKKNAENNAADKAATK